MSCNETCSNNKKGYIVPVKKIISLNELKNEFAGQDNPYVYCYIIDTIKYNDNKEFIQCGTGPNFKGNLITLCTCKHLMRSALTPEKWKGKWIAGFTGRNCVQEHKGKNFIVYLMRISNAYESFHQLWNNGIKDTAKNAKAAHLNEYGDIYVPINSDEYSSFKPDHYFGPCENSLKATCWQEDVNYQGYSERRASLLAGDQKKSFIWNKPEIYLKGQLSRNCKKLTLKDFLGKMKQM